MIRRLLPAAEPSAPHAALRSDNGDPAKGEPAARLHPLPPSGGLERLAGSPRAASRRGPSIGRRGTGAFRQLLIDPS